MQLPTAASGAKSRNTQHRGARANITNSSDRDHSKRDSGGHTYNQRVSACAKDVATPRSCQADRSHTSRVSGSTSSSPLCSAPRPARAHARAVAAVAAAAVAAIAAVAAVEAPAQPMPVYRGSRAPANRVGERHTDHRS